MAETMTLMEFIKKLLGIDDESAQLREAFQKDPQATLAHYGLGDLSAADVHDAMVLVQDNDTVGFDRHYDTGSNWVGATSGDGHGSIDWAKAGVHAPGPQVREHVTENHVTNNIDDRDTIVDNSVNQNIHADGNVNQHFDNHSVTASGDGAVAAGGTISGSTVTTGDGNVVGNGNHVVNGDHNTTAFGDGSAVKGVSVDHGSGFSVEGNASGNASTNNSHNQNHFEDNDRTEIHNSGNVDDDHSVHTSLDDHSQTHVGSDNDLTFHVL